MADLISLAEFSRKKRLDECIESFKNLSEEVEEVGKEYLELTENNPEEAIQKLPEFLYRMRKTAAPGGLAYEGLAGGPNQDWTMPLINFSGRFYEFLNREQKTEMLHQVLDYFDGLRCDYVQNHMELIEEPLLARDILVNRQIYYPGWEPYDKLLRQCKDWGDFKEGLKKDEGTLIRSPFWLTFAMIRPQVSSLPVRIEYYKKFPELVDKTLDAKAGLTAVWNREYGVQEKYTEEQIQNKISDSVNRADPLLHEKLWEKIKKEDWILVKR